jgi:hypothetical protein
MIQLSATRCSCIAIFRVTLVSFAAVTLFVASQRMFVVYFIMTQSGNFWIYPHRMRLVASQTSTLRTRTEMVFKTLVFSPLNHLTQLTARENFIIPSYTSTSELQNRCRFVILYDSIIPRKQSVLHGICQDHVPILALDNVLHSRQTSELQYIKKKKKSTRLIFVC